MTRERLRALLLSVLPLTLVAVVGWWAEDTVGRVMRDRAADRVRTVLAGAASAVTTVSGHQRSLVSWVAHEPQVRTGRSA